LTGVEADMNVEKKEETLQECKTMIICTEKRRYLA
jgi:hypothetical protein